MVSGNHFYLHQNKKKMTKERDINKSQYYNYLIYEKKHHKLLWFAVSAQFILKERHYAFLEKCQNILNATHPNKNIMETLYPLKKQISQKENYIIVAAKRYHINLNLTKNSSLLLTWLLLQGCFALNNAKI